jgi:tetratricopeptide (TPR) repeat protein
MAAGAACVLLLGAASAVQVRTWKDAVSMWRNCMRVDPGNGLVRCFLAESLARRGESRQAKEQYEIAIALSAEDTRELPADSARAMSHLAWLLATCEDQSLRDYDRAIRLGTEAYQRNPKYLRELTLIYSNIGAALADRGEYVQAIEHYNRALELHPSNLPALFQLAALRATCRDEKLRDPQEAVRLAERGCELAEPPTADRLGVLATAYAEAGRLDEAIATAKRAARQARAAGNATLAEEMQGRSELYRERASNRPTR